MKKKKSRGELISWSSQSKTVNEDQVNVKDNVQWNYMCGAVKVKDEVSEQIHNTNESEW